MSGDVVKCTEALVHAMLNSEEYQNYQRYEGELRSKPKLREQVDEFRIRNYHLQRQEGIDLYEEVDNLEREFEHVRKNALANAYLEAELAVCKMMQDTQTALVKSLNISIPDEV